MVKTFIFTTTKPRLKNVARIGGEINMYNNNIKNKNKNKILKILRIPNWSLNREVSGLYRFAESFSKVQSKFIVRKVRCSIQRYARDMLTVFFSNINVKGFSRVRNTLYLNGIPVLTVNKTNVEVTVMWRNKYIVITEVFGNGK